MCLTEDQNSKCRTLEWPPLRCTQRWQYDRRRRVSLGLALYFKVRHVVLHQPNELKKNSFTPGKAWWLLSKKVHTPQFWNHFWNCLETSRFRLLWTRLIILFWIKANFKTVSFSLSSIFWKLLSGYDRLSFSAVTLDWTLGRNGNLQYFLSRLMARFGCVWPCRNLSVTQKYINSCRVD